MLDQDFPDFKDDMITLRKLGVIKGNDEANSLTVGFIDRLIKYMIDNNEEFYEYDLTEPILRGIEEVLLTYNITDKGELDRMTLIITSWINIMLQNGGFYDLN